MASHASRHIVSEHLQDRHPWQGQPFPQGVIRDEICVAYGRRCIPKLVAVLDLPENELPVSERIHCLKVLLPLLSTQEVKIDALSAGVCSPLVHHLQCTDSLEVRELCCQALTSLAHMMPGREAIVRARGLDVLTNALLTAPDAAVTTLKAISQSIDGSEYLQQSPARVVAALVDLIQRPSTSYEAAMEAVDTLAGVTTTEEGLIDALACEVPLCVVKLINRVVKHDLPGNELLLGVLKGCAKCLRQLCHHADGKAQVREAEGIPALSKLLSVPDEYVVQQATSALMAISVEKESKLLVMNHAGAILIPLIKTGPQATAQNARLAVLNAVEDLDARRKLELLMTQQEQSVLLGNLATVPPDYKYVVQTAAPPAV
eukprot:jgi/Chrzof1/14971/Cz09g22200.t1